MHDFDADIDISCAHRLFLCAIPIRCAPDQSTCRYHHRIVPSLASHKLGRSLWLLLTDDLKSCLQTKCKRSDAQDETLYRAADLVHTVCRQLPRVLQGDQQPSRLGCWLSWCMARLKGNVKNYKKKFFFFSKTMPHLSMGYIGIKLIGISCKVWQSF